MNSKPMGMMTMYEVRMGIQKAIREFETNKNRGDGHELAVGGYLALLKTYELEIYYRNNRWRTGPIEFFGVDELLSKDMQSVEENFFENIFNIKYFYENNKTDKEKEKKDD